jgi:hypothetical protein
VPTRPRTARRTTILFALRRVRGEGRVREKKKVRGEERGREKDRRREMLKFYLFYFLAFFLVYFGYAAVMWVLLIAFVIYITVVHEVRVFFKFFLLLTL